jgi:hypothetical protein
MAKLCGKSGDAECPNKDYLLIAPACCYLY